jgi:hypothetical protein
MRPPGRHPERRPERRSGPAGRHQQRVREQGGPMFFDWVRIVFAAILFVVMIVVLGIGFLVVGLILLVFMIFLI